MSPGLDWLSLQQRCSLRVPELLACKQWKMISHRASWRLILVEPLWQPKTWSPWQSRMEPQKHLLEEGGGGNRLMPSQRCTQTTNWLLLWRHGQAENRVGCCPNPWTSKRSWNCVNTSYVSEADEGLDLRLQGRIEDRLEVMLPIRKKGDCYWLEEARTNALDLVIHPEKSSLEGCWT